MTPFDEDRAWERHRRVRRVAVTATAVAMVAVSVMLSRFHPDRTPDAALDDIGRFRVRGSDRPPPSPEERRSPRGRPPDIRESSRRFRFIRTQADGSLPVAYDPCRPLHYVINDRTAPRDGEAFVTSAVERISEATGLEFIYDGPTTEAPRRDRRAYQPGRYGKRWAPILVAWTDPSEEPGLEGSTVGLGGSQALQASAHNGSAESIVYVTGGVSLDGPQVAEIVRDGDAGPERVEAVILHELGHVLGLGHIDDPAQLMHAEETAVTDFGPGDLNGLALLGRGACFPTV